jgi:tRNA pseudouridine13 synthase
VDEEFDAPWSGEGEHLMLRITKRDITTNAIARMLEKHFNVDGRSIGYAGMKDRQAVTTQWFSVHVPDGAAPAELDKAQVVEVTRHRTKLRRGEHSLNRFVVRLRGVSEPHVLGQRLSDVADGGFPNYFGEQRFGGDNLECASAWIGSRKRLTRFKKSLYLSTLRSFLFNEVLAARIADGTWACHIDGDCVQDGSATAPMWGRGRSLSAGVALALETAVLEPYERLRDGLEHGGVKQDRRPLCVQPLDLNWEITGQDVIVRCALRPGSYMTSLLREVCLPTQTDEQNQDDAL